MNCGASMSSAQFGLSHLTNLSFKHGDPRCLTTALGLQEAGLNTYFVMDPWGRRSNVHVVTGPYGPCLRSAANATGVDNLDALPGC